FCFGSHSAPKAKRHSGAVILGRSHRTRESLSHSSSRAKEGIYAVKAPPLHPRDAPRQPPLSHNRHEKPPSVSDLRRGLGQLISALDRHRGSCEPIESFTLAELAVASCDDLQARDPIEFGLQCAARNIARRLAKHFKTMDELQRVVENIAFHNIERVTARSVLLDSIFDGATTKDGERWIA